MRKTSICFLLSLTFTFVGSPNARAQEYTVTDLKTIPPYYYTAPSAINSSGEVVGTAYGLSTPTIVFRWTPATGIQNVGQGEATAVDSAGDIAGYVVVGSYFHAFLWMNDGTTQDLGTLGGNNSEASGINSADYVVGNSDLSDSLGPDAFLWTPQNGMQDLGTLNGYGASSALGINASGEVVGYDYTPTGGPVEAFSWMQAGGMQGIGASQAIGVNNAGLIVGLGSNGHAQLWQGGTTKDLGTLGGTESSAAAINARGAVVGFSTISTSSDVDHAFIWTSAKGMQDLNLMVPSTIQQKWVLQGATAINGAGQIAVQALPATGAQITHGFLLSPQMDVTLSSSTNPSAVGEAVTFTAKITSVAGPPPNGEQVTFKSGSTVLGTSMLSAGIATFQTSTLTQGTHTITATYAGDANYASAKSPALSQVVSK
jgi:probable HAF family extracellular repeat protein